MSNRTSLFWQGAIAVAIFCVIALIFVMLGRKEDEVNTEYYAPGLAFYNEGDYVDAEKDFQQYLNQYSNMPSAAPSYYQMGMCFLHEGRREEAQEEFQNAIDHARPAHHQYDSVASKAQAALAWMQQNPNWQPPPPGQAATVPGPPQDFPAR